MGFIVDSVSESYAFLKAVLSLLDLDKILSANELHNVDNIAAEAVAATT